MKPEARPVVLVVDDDPTMRESLDFVLKDRYEVLSCASAKDGLAALREDVCVVVLDVKLRGNDGFWACDEIRKREPDMPIIFYSAYQDLKDPYDIINQHRPFGYIVKGTDLEILLNRIDMAVRIRKLLLENRRLLAALQGQKHRRAE